MLVLVLGVVTSWLWRRWVEKAGVQVGTAVVQAGRHRLGEQVARMPVGWFTPQNTARLEHVITQGMMSVAQLPAHVFTPLISGVITSIVLVITLWMLHPLLGVIALVALPLLAGAFALTTRLARGADTVFQRDFAQSSQRIVEFTQAQSVLRAFQGEAGSARFVQQAIALQQHSGLRVIGRSALSTVINTWAVQLVLAMLLVTCVAWLNGVVDAGLNLPEVVTVVVALLMVSRLRYNSFKGGSGPKSDRVPFIALPIAVGILIALWVDPPKTLLAAATIYALSGPVLWFWRRHEGGAGAKGPA